MDNQEKLKNYIYEQIQSGINSNEIAQQLRTSGWDETAIQAAFSAVQASIAPTPPTFPAQPLSPTSQQTETPSSYGPEQTQPTQQPGSTTSAHFEPTGKKRGRLKTAWLLLKQSLKILKYNKQLLRYPFMGGLICLLITIVVGLIMFMSGDTFIYSTVDALGQEESNLTWPGMLVGFVYYVIAYFIIFMYNAGLAAHVLDVFRGKSQNYQHYMSIAWSKRGPIFLYSLISATVGIILDAIEQRSRLVGYIVSRILGAVWRLANLFTIPVIVDSEASATSAIKQSTQLFISRWGENIGARIGFGGLAFLLYLLVLIPFIIVMAIISSFLGVAGFVFLFAVIFISLIVFITIESAASNILSTALYFYAKYQQIPAAFEPELLNAVFIPKKQRRGLFGKKPANPTTT